MAIQFRCDHCRTLMSISSRKAGSVVRCASCDEEVLVPVESSTASRTLPPSAIETIRHAPPDADQEEIADSPENDPVPDEIAPTASAAAERQDRVALPDDFFDFEPDEQRQPDEPALAESGEGENEFSEIFEDFPNQLAESLPEPPAVETEVPPHRTADDVAPQFVVQLRKSTIDDEMDLTPMVDVVFQLLIFFMVTASFALHKTIETPTPESNQKGATQSIQSLEELEGVAILVRIDAQNGITIDDDPLADDSRVADALVDKMRKEQKSEVIITADPAAWHRTVIKVVDAANAVGMQKIRLATRAGADD